MAVPFYLAGRGLAVLWPSIEERHAATERMGVARSEYFGHLLVGWRNPLLGAPDLSDDAWLYGASITRNRGPNSTPWDRIDS